MAGGWIDFRSRGYTFYRDCRGLEGVTIGDEEDDRRASPGYHVGTGVREASATERSSVLMCGYRVNDIVEGP